jgi:hypothetical protein
VEEVPEAAAPPGSISISGAPPKAIRPDAPPPSEIIGAGVPRIDGPLKTTGTARYASDYNFPGLVFAFSISRIFF